MQSLNFFNSNGTGTSGIFGYNVNHTTGEGLLTFGTRNSSGTFSEKMRIDSSGNVLVGKTNTTSAFTTVGVDLRPEGRSFMTRDGGPALYLSRTTSDGNIVEFRKDGSTVGSIGTNTISSNSRFRIGSGDVHLMFRPDIESIQPANDSGVRNNAIDLGNSASKFKDLYLGGGVYLGGTGSDNFLDDYEEGTHDPSLTDGTYTADIGTAKLAYTKVGNMVTITGYFYVNSYNASATASRVTLPFAIADLSNNAGDFAGTVRSRKLNTSNTHHVIAHGDEGNGYVLLQEIVDNGDPVNIGGSAYSAGTHITLNFSYFTS